MAEQEEVDYKQKYRSLKRKLRFLIYEQECFHEELRRSQRKLLKVSRDKSFLLDRLMQYERVEESASSAESTDSSDADIKKAAQEKKQKKKAKKRKKKLTQVKPVLTQDNSDKTPLLANLAFSSTLTQQMSQQIAELMSKGTSNLPGSTTSQPFAGLGATGKQAQSNLPASTSTSSSQPSTSANTSLSSGNILERALQSPSNLSAVSLGNQTTSTSSSSPHTVGMFDNAPGKKKIKREPAERPSIHQASPKVKIEESSEAGPEDLVMDLPELPE